MLSIRHTITTCLLLSFSLLFLPIEVSCQPLDSLWSRTYGGWLADVCHCVRQTTDGGYIMVGSTESFGAGETDVWLMKVDAQGDYEWDRTYGGPNWDYCYTTRQTYDGGYILPCNTGAMEPSQNNCWILKVDSVGNEEWNLFFPYTYGEFREVVQLPDSGYIIAGSGDGPGGGATYDGWVLGVGSGGDSLWSYYYGGMDSDYFTSLQLTSDGGCVVAGYSNQYGTTDSNYLIVKLDSHGNYQWSNTFGGVWGEQCHGVEQMQDGGYVLAGYSESFGAGIYDWWLVRTDANGDSLWSRTYGGDQKDECWAMTQTSEGGFLLAGHTESFGFGHMYDPDIWVVMVDSVGNNIWNRTYGGVDYDYGYSIQRTMDGGYVLAGITGSFGAGSSDFWLIKLGHESAVEPQQEQTPCQFTLDQNYPNPFNSSTQIAFRLPAQCHVLLRVFDIEGRVVTVLSDGVFGVGRHSVLFDAAWCSSGLYFCQLQSDYGAQTMKMVLLK